MVRRLFALVLVAALALIVAACSSTEGTTTTTGALATTARPTTTAAPETTVVLPRLEGFTSTRISIDDREMAVAVADTAEKRRQGLMNVTDLGGLGGMLFVWSDDTASAFHMLDTLIPLDIAFFTVDGSFVDRLTMEPCTADECPLYSASGLYRYALEAPAGDLEFTSSGSKLIIDGDS